MMHDLQQHCCKEAKHHSSSLRLGLEWARLPSMLQQSTRPQQTVSQQDHSRRASGRAKASGLVCMMTQAHKAQLLNRVHHADDATAPAMVLLHSQDHGQP